MFEKARAHRDAHTYVATNYDEFKDIIANKPGFVKAMWCGDRGMRRQDQRRNNGNIQMYAICTGTFIRCMRMLRTSG